MSNEIWRDVVGYEGVYEVSDQGQVRRGDRVKVPTPGKDRYLRVMLWVNNKNRLFLVHRLVAIAFFGIPPKGKEVNHINGNKADNRLSNLEYVTRSENNRHAYRTGLKTKPIGEKSPRALLTENDVLEARRIHIPFDKVFGARALARKYRVAYTTMRCALEGKSWKHL